MNWQTPVGMIIVNTMKGEDVEFIPDTIYDDSFPDNTEPITEYRRGNKTIYMMNFKR